MSATAKSRQQNRCSRCGQTGHNRANKICPNFSKETFVSVGKVLVKESNKEPDTCSICLEILGNNRSTTSCGHTFCTDCLMTSVRLNQNCPMCRQQVGRQINQPTDSDSDSDSDLEIVVDSDSELDSDTDDEAERIENFRWGFSKGIHLNDEYMDTRRCISGYEDGWNEGKKVYEEIYARGYQEAMSHANKTELALRKEVHSTHLNLSAEKAKYESLREKILRLSIS